MEESQIQPSELGEVVSFLSKLDLFENIDRDSLNELTKNMTWISLKGGEIMIKKGEIDTSLFILYHGRLRIYSSTDNENENSHNSIAEVSVGQIIGEMALLTEQPRSQTVKSVRYSKLIKLSELTFKSFVNKHPEAALKIAKTAVKRLLSKAKPTEAGEKIVTITVLPTGDSDHRELAQKLCSELNREHSVIFINEEICLKKFGKDPTYNIKNLELDSIISWLNDLENQYTYVVYETNRSFKDGKVDLWTEICLNQADRLVFAAEENKSANLNPIELKIFSKSCEIWPYIDIVFIHPERKEITGTAELLKNRHCNNYHHVCFQDNNSLKKFIRFLTGKTFGLVLSGGGARGFAFFGVLKALEEMKIPIDAIGGSSMGAFMSALYANYSIQDCILLTQEIIRKFRHDYTLPLVSIMKGKHNTELFKYLWQDKDIRDLWIRFFCVSSNVTKGKVKVHEEGPIWLAVRSSASIPIVYPPMYDDNGDMLIDGSLINNLPVDIMKKRICGGKILAIKCLNLNSKLVHNTNDKSWISGWSLMFQKINFLKKDKIKYNGFLSVLTSAIGISSKEHTLRVETDADYLLTLNSTAPFNYLDFSRGEEIIEAGYLEAKEALVKLNIELT